MKQRLPFQVRYPSDYNEYGALYGEYATEGEAIPSKNKANRDFKAHGVRKTAHVRNLSHIHNGR